MTQIRFPKDGIMRFFFSLVILLLAFTSAAFGQDALSIDNNSNVNVKENLTVHGNFMVKGEPDLQPGFIFGLETSMGTETNEIIIKPGLCRSYIGEHYVDYQDLPITTSYGESTNITLEQSLEVYLRVDPSNPWSETNRVLFGNKQVLPNETYHLFVIKGEDANGNPKVSAGFDSDIDCVNIPDGYTAYRRIASVTTDDSSIVRPYSQHGDEFMFNDPESYEIQVGSSSRVNKTLACIPKGLKLKLNMQVSSGNPGAWCDIMWSDPDQPDIPVTGSNADFVRSTSYTSFSHVEKYTNTSAEIGIRATRSVMVSSKPRGYTDDRGQYGGK